MSFHLVKNAVILSTLFPIGLANALNNPEELIPCPRVNIIQSSNQYLDVAQKINDAYIAYTAASVYQSHNLWWFVGVGDIKANSAHEAINIGRNLLNNANEQMNEFATKIGNEYICQYSPGYIQARGKSF